MDSLYTCTCSVVLFMFDFAGFCGYEASSLPVGILD